MSAKSPRAVDAAPPFPKTDNDSAWTRNDLQIGKALLHERWTHHRQSPSASGASGRPFLHPVAQLRAMPPIVSLFVLAAMLLAAGAIWRRVSGAMHELPGETAVALASGAAKEPTSDAARMHPLGEGYAVLQRRSIFAKASSGEESAKADSRSNPSAAYALKGVCQEDASFTAYVEDTAAKRIFEVHPGDALGKGKVRDMSLHGLSVEVEGQVMVVEVGQQIDGDSLDAAVKVARAQKHPASADDAHAATDLQ